MTSPLPPPAPPLALPVAAPAATTAAAAAAAALAAQDARLLDAWRRERTRLTSFVRRRVLDSEEAEDLLQDVMMELLEAERVLQPIENAGAWLFRVARNRITDLFRKRRPELGSSDSLAISNAAADADDLPAWEDLLPSPDAGPDARYVRDLLLDEVGHALEELPPEQREAFIAHEFDGVSFKTLAARSGESINTWLGRKHAAVLHLRRRLQAIYDDFEPD